LGGRPPIAELERLHFPSERIKKVVEDVAMKEEA
jgi:hypothetical protein